MSHGYSDGPRAAEGVINHLSFLALSLICHQESQFVVRARRAQIRALLETVFPKKRVVILAFARVFGFAL